MHDEKMKICSGCSHLEFLVLVVFVHPPCQISGQRFRIDQDRFLPNTFLHHVTITLQSALYSLRYRYSRKTKPH